MLSVAKYPMVICFADFCHAERREVSHVIHSADTGKGN